MSRKRVGLAGLTSNAEVFIIEVEVKELVSRRREPLSPCFGLSGGSLSEIFPLTPSQQVKEMKELKERNKEIKRNYKLGQGGVIGRQLGISRQRVGQIIHKKHKGVLRQLLKRLWYWWIK